MYGVAVVSSPSECEKRTKASGEKLKKKLQQDLPHSRKGNELDCEQCSPTFFLRSRAQSDGKIMQIRKVKEEGLARGRKM